MYYLAEANKMYKQFSQEILRRRRVAEETDGAAPQALTGQG
jgi:hypothetical protein